MNILEVGYCRICGTGCVWIPMMDGLLAKLEVCSPECMEKFLKELKEKGEVEGKQ